jgi:hypothetical protein
VIRARWHWWERGVGAHAMGGASGGGGTSAVSSWRREGERDPRPVGRSAGWLLDGLGRKAEQAGRLAGLTGSELKRNSFRNKNWIFEFTKALEICRRRFRRNFDTRIFPKFF